MTTFIYYDGDDMGAHFHTYFVMDDRAALESLSSKLKAIHARIYSILPMYHAKLIEAGGDEGLIQCSRAAEGLIREIEDVWFKEGLTATVGQGQTISDAYFACRRRKDLF